MSAKINVTLTRGSILGHMSNWFAFDFFKILQQIHVFKKLTCGLNQQLFFFFWNKKSITLEQTMYS